MNLIQAFLAKFYQAIIIVMAVFLLLSFIGLGVQTWRVNYWEIKAQNAKSDCYDKIQEMELKRIKDLQDKQNEINQVSSDYEAEKSNQKVRVETVTRELQTIIERPVYFNNCFDGDGLSKLNSLITDGSE